MAKKVLSIEISRTLVKVCEVDYKAKTSKVYQCFTFMTPSGAYEDGYIMEAENFGNYLKGQLAAHGVKNNKVVFTVTSARIANREVFIPFVKEKQIGSIVESNAKDYFPVDINGYQVAHNVIDIVENNGSKQYKLLVLAAPKDMLESYFLLAKMAGLSVEAIDYSGNSIVPVIKNAVENDTTMIIKVDEHATLLTIMKNKAVVMQRNLTMGADVAIETVQDMDAFGTEQTYDDALNMLRGKTLIRKTFDEAAYDDADENGNEAYNNARIELTDSLRSLVSGIIRVVDYYNSRNSEDPIKKYLLTGFGGDFSGLSKLLTNEIGSKVTVLSHVNGINLDKSIDSQRVSFGEYIACIGAAISPIDFIPDERKKGAKGANKKEGGNIFTKDLSDLNTDQIMLILGVVGILVAISMAAITYVKYFEVKIARDALESKVEELKPYQTIYDDYNNAVRLSDDVQTMYNLTVDSNEQIVLFLAEMQIKMPRSIAVESIESDKESLAVTMNVTSKEDVGKAIEAFRTFDAVKDVEFEQAVFTEDQSGAPVWNFTVTAYYKDPVAPDEAEAVEDVAAGQAAGEE